MELVLIQSIKFKLKTNTTTEFKLQIRANSKLGV